MIGFEIYINDEKPIIMASDSIISVILRYGYPSEAIISLIGRDCSNDLTWLKGKPEIGDKIIIKVIYGTADCSLSKTHGKSAPTKSRA